MPTISIIIVYITTLMFIICFFIRIYTLLPSDPPQPHHADDDVDTRHAIDVVYTWVNNSESTWLLDFDNASKNHVPEIELGNKYREWDELRYSMRSINEYAPWVRRIYIVTSSKHQVPTWLDTNHPRIRMVFHDELFPDPLRELPTFNSLAIETVLHRIPTLSNHFLYFNNDVLIGRPLAFDPTFVAAGLSNTTEYIQYYDWKTGIERNYMCRQQLSQNVIQNNKQLFYLCTRFVSFYFDMVLAQQFWHQPFIPYWFAHIPHLWERRVLFDIERTMNDPHLKQTRQTKFRDPNTDITMHLQYESWLIQHQHLPGEYKVKAISASDHRTPNLDTGRPSEPFYTYVIFDNTALFKYKQWSEQLRTHPPQFFTIDDDLKTTNEQVLQLHRQQLHSLFETHWPWKAPWEL